ncbi:MAG: T9SS type A sorting domain-containing protein [Calditrichaeota bacterium]|nr:T9SS type A sorting domain-containing protein [Calditrichota bacterium]
MRLRLFVLLCLMATTAFGQVMLNEFLYDTQGTDDTSIMYTEIYGPAGTDLTGWTLVGINGNGGTAYATYTLSGSIPSDGYFVVGGAAVQNVDQILPHDLQNAGSSTGEDCDGLELRNSGGTLIDHVCYGNCASGHICNGEGGSNAPDPFPSQGINYALSRIPDHTDTDNNGADWSQSDILTPGEANDGVPCEPVDATLEEIRENDSDGVPALIGTFVVVRGIVNVDNYTLDSLTESSFYFQDDNAGCNVFRGTVPTGIMEGDCVEVSGWVGQFNGLTEIVSSGAGNCSFHVEILEEGGEVTPLVLTTTSAFEAFEGMLAEVRNLTIVGGDPWPTGAGQNANITVTDGNGTMTVRIDGDSQAGTAPQPSTTFTARGIITQFDNSSPYSDGYQLTLRYPADVIAGSAAGDSPDLLAENFKLLSSYPNPFNGVTNIELAVGSAREIQVTITDVLGREVYGRTLTNLTPGNVRFQWQPEGAAGLYFLRAQSGANMQSTKLLYLK